MLASNRRGGSVGFPRSAQGLSDMIDPVPTSTPLSATSEHCHIFLKSPVGSWLFSAHQRLQLSLELLAYFIRRRYCRCSVGVRDIVGSPTLVCQRECARRSGLTSMRALGWVSDRSSRGRFAPKCLPSGQWRQPRSAAVCQVVSTCQMACINAMPSTEEA